MELDRKVRDFPLPEGLSNPSKNDIGASFQRCVLDHIKETGQGRFFSPLMFIPNCHPSSHVYASQLLCPGHDRTASQSSQVCLCSILHCRLSCCPHHSQIHRRTIQSLSQFMFPLLDHVDVCFHRRRKLLQIADVSGIISLFRSFLEQLLPVVRALH